VISTIILIYFCFKKFKTTTIHFLILCIGFYSVYASYTRTGWIALILGIFMLYYFGQKKWKFMIKIIPIVLISFFVFKNQIMNNDSVRMRLMGSRVNVDNSELDLDQFSSNRLTLNVGALFIIDKANVVGKLIGFGQVNAITKMGEETGMPLSAHNRFLEITLIGGLISLVVYVMFLIFLYKVIFNVNSNSKITHLLKSLFIILVFFNIPSHGFPLWGNYLFGLAIAYRDLTLDGRKE